MNPLNGVTVTYALCITSSVDLTYRRNNIIVGVSYALSVCGYGQTGIGLTDGVFANNVIYATDSNSFVGVRTHGLVTRV